MSTTPPSRGRARKPLRIPLLLVVGLLLGLLAWALVRGTWASAAANNPTSAADGVTSQLYRAPDGEIQVRGAMVIDAPAAKVWAVVRDYPNHPRFLPHLKTLEIQSKEGGHVHLAGVAHTTLWGDWPFAMDMVHTVNADKEYTASWDEAGGALTVNRGSWTVTALSPRQTLVVLAMRWEAPRYPSFLMHNLLLNRLPSMVEGLRDEVNRREKGS